MKASPPPEPPPPPPPPPPPSTHETPPGFGGRTPRDTGLPKPEEAAPAKASVPASWPDWFGAVDLALVLVVVVVGFLLASFAARNSDVWLHLASGRALVQGTISPGSDPFSFSGADRTWVQSSWLFDLGFYALHSLDPAGAVAVGLKAFAFTAAFGLVALLRRPGHSLWPWAVLTACGLLASAPSATLRPAVASMLFLSITLVLLYRLPWKPGGWREPAIVAGVIWVWTNLDAWALLGPLLLALVTAGAYLNRFLVRDEEPEPAGPFFPAPPKPALVRALVLGLVAYLLNPMFLAAAVKDPVEALTQLVPPELGVGIPEIVTDDPELAFLLVTPWSDDYRNSPALGYSLNGLGFVIVLVGSLAALAAGFNRLQATHILLWFVFAGLAFQHVRLIPYFAIVAIPLAAAHLNGLSMRLNLGPAEDPGTRVLLTASGLGRVLCLALGLATAGGSYPGWLHPQVGDPAFYNRVEWVLAPDPGLERTARRLAAWRADGTLPDSVRGLSVSPEFANYCAWFAPGEKVFINGRYTFHRRELGELMTIRRNVVGRRAGRSEGALDVGEVVRVCDQARCAYLVVTTPSRRGGDPARFIVPVLTLLDVEENWEAWHLDGRSAILGRPDTAPSGWRRPLFDPVRLAFGPDVEKVPDGKTVPVPVPRESILDAYADRPQPVPPAADDAVVLAAYTEFSSRRAELHFRFQVLKWQSARAAVAGIAAAYLVVDRQPTADDQIALPVLITRAARRAVVAAPDRPEGYYALSMGYRHPFTVASDLSVLPPPSTTTVQHLQLVTALVRYFARVPAPEACTEGQAAQVMQESLRLAELYQSSGQLDLCRDAVRKAVAYARVVRTETLREMSGAGPKDEPLKRLQQQEDELNRLIDQEVDRVERQTSPRSRFSEAQRRRLPGLAIKTFKDADPKEFGSDSLPIAFAMIVMELGAGRLEDAAADLATLDERLKDESAATARGQYGPILRELQSIQYRLEGNYTALDQALNQGGVPTFPPDQVRVIAELPVVFLGATALAGPAAGLQGAALPTVNPQAQPPRLPVDAFLMLRQALLTDALYQYDRALVALAQGNIPEAKRRLDLAAKPQGVGLDRLGDPARLGRINRYRQLIEKAQAPAKQ